MQSKTPNTNQNEKEKTLMYTLQSYKLFQYEE